MKLIQSVNQNFFKKVPKVTAGQTVRVHQKIREGEKERIQVYEGLVIKVSSGTGTSKTFTVRKVFQGIGVEKIFPFHSPNIAKVEVVKASKVRRAKLYYMRDLAGKAARLKERILSAKDLAAMEKDTVEKMPEEPKKTAKKAEAVEEPETTEPAIEEVTTEETPTEEVVEEPKEEEAKNEDTEKSA